MCVFYRTSLTLLQRITIPTKMRLRTRRSRTLWAGTREQDSVAGIERILKLSSISHWPDIVPSWGEQSRETRELIIMGHRYLLVQLCLLFCCRAKAHEDEFQREIQTTVPILAPEVMAAFAHSQIFHENSAKPKGEGSVCSELMTSSVLHFTHFDVNCDCSSVSIHFTTKLWSSIYINHTRIYICCICIDPGCQPIHPFPIFSLDTRRRFPKTLSHTSWAT